MHVVFVLFAIVEALKLVLSTFSFHVRFRRNIHLYFFRATERVCADCRVIEANGCTFETSLVQKSGNVMRCDPNYSGSGTSYLMSPKMAFLGYLCTAGKSLLNE
jgi:hypothetical protein